MRSQEIARRYAAALYGVAVEDGASVDIEQELASVVETTVDDPDVRRFLAHPLVPRERKSAFIHDALPALSERMKTFLELVLRNKRETYLDLIYQEFVDIRTTDEGSVQVAMTTAQALTSDDRDRLIQRLETALNRPVVLEERIDARLLGGARIEAAGHVMDGTIRARLGELRAQLEE